ncbi:hypothetical protein [Streptomonospora sediminis]
MRIRFDRLSAAAACAAALVPAAACGGAASGSGDSVQAGETAAATEKAVPDRLSKIRPEGAACLTGSGALIGHLDADDHYDAVVDLGDSGEDVVIAWGGEDGHTDPVGVRGLIGAGKEDWAVSAAADFTGDGLLDLVVATGAEPGGDEPMDPEPSELRVGPLNRDGTAERADAIEFGELRALAATDLNGDDNVDLAGWEYLGDGVEGRTSYLGTNGGVSAESASEFSYDEFERPYGPELPKEEKRLQAFYPKCPEG